MVRVDVMHAFGGGWARYGRAPVTSGIGGREYREGLGIGDFLPSPITNGLIYGTDIATMTQVGTGANSNTVLTGTDYTDTIWWTKVKMARTGIGGAPTKLHNCAVAGPAPENVTSGDVFYLLSCYDEDTPQWTADDVLIDPFLWMRADAPGGARTETQIREAYINSIGIKGGYVTARNLKIKNCEDDWQWSNARTSDVDTRFTLLENCWLERPICYQGPLWPSQPEGTHSDNLQPQVGQNFTMRGGMLGGPDDPDLDASYGTQVTWKQEAWTRAGTPEITWRKMRNMHFDRVILWSATGGNYMMNLAYNGTYPNDFSDDCDVLGCLFVQRADAKYFNRSATYYAHMDSTTNRIISDPTSGEWSDLGAVTYHNG